MPYLFLLAGLFIGWTSSVEACLGVSSETRTYLSQLPSQAKSRRVVAKIQIISSIQNKEETLTQAKVVEGIKGIKKGAVISIRSPGEIRSSCDRNPDSLTPGLLYYIAGSFGPDGIFEGVSKGE